ncbi:MAG TPA: SRPBCC family protein [Chthoniobacterales bacterium]
MLLDGPGFLLAPRAAIWQRIDMKSAAQLLGIIVVLVLLAIGISFLLPAQTRHTRVLTLKQTPGAVFTVLSDVEKFPTWNRNLEKTERLAPIDGKEAMKQTFKGGVAVTVVTTESLAPTHLVHTVRAGNGGNSFSGSWTYDVTPLNDGCDVVLTEKSYIANPMLRLMMRLFGSTRYIDQHLVDLARHFGERPIIRSMPAERG